MGRRETLILSIAEAIAVVVVCVLVFDPFGLGFADLLENFGFDATNIVERSVLGSVPSGISEISKERFYADKRYKLGCKSNRIGSNLYVFKGRKARLNRAIFSILADEGPKSISNCKSFRLVKGKLVCRG